MPSRGQASWEAPVADFAILWMPALRQNGTFLKCCF